MSRFQKSSELMKSIAASAGMVSDISTELSLALESGRLYDAITLAAKLGDSVKAMNSLFRLLARQVEEDAHAR